ncbi:MAG: GxxExxY protein [Phycisphaerae bacterium]
MSSDAGAYADYPHRELTEKVIGCAIHVHRELGPGYLESIYENALAHELRKRGLSVDTQYEVPVVYDNVKVGLHRADILVDGAVVVELKSVEALVPKHKAQLISTLKAVGASVGLLMNFNEARLAQGLKRVVLTGKK